MTVAIGDDQSIDIWLNIALEGMLFRRDLSSDRARNLQSSIFYPGLISLPSIEQWTEEFLFVFEWNLVQCLVGRKWHWFCSVIFFYVDVLWLFQTLVFVLVLRTAPLNRVCSFIRSSCSILISSIVYYRLFASTCSFVHLLHWRINSYYTYTRTHTYTYRREQIM